MYLGYSVKSKTLVQEIMRVMILITEIMPEKMIEETMIEENSEIQEILERIEELIIEEKMIGELIIEERMIGEMIIGETTIEETIIEETIIAERMIGEMIIEETIIGEMMIEEMTIEEMIIEETTIEETTIEETTIEETTIEETTIEEMIIEETTIATAIIVAIQVAPVLWTEELRIRSAKTITMTPPMTTDITQTAIITMTSEANWSTAKIRANSALTAATAASLAMRVVIRTASITPTPRIIVRTTKRNVLASCVCALFVNKQPIRLSCSSDSSKLNSTCTCRLGCLRSTLKTRFAAMALGCSYTDPPSPSSSSCCPRSSISHASQPVPLSAARSAVRASLADSFAAFESEPSLPKSTAAAPA